MNGKLFDKVSVGERANELVINCDTLLVSGILAGSLDIPIWQNFRTHNNFVNKGYQGVTVKNFNARKLLGQSEESVIVRADLRIWGRGVE